jgi:YHS domain-containing protein
MNFMFIMSMAASLCWASSGNVDKTGVIIQGYDVVSYFAGQPQRGNFRYQALYNGATYLFVNEANKEKFIKAPQNYAPQFGGWCAYAVADSQSKVEVDPMSYLIQDGKLLLFYNGLFADTRKKWQKDPKSYLLKANTSWPVTETKDP